MLEISNCDMENKPKILVIGIGGGGNNAIDRMVSACINGVEFAAINTDVDVLDNSLAEIKIQIGAKSLKGYGAGADPSLGEAAATENEEEIRKLVEGKDMIIITCGMGGGTGTGASPVVAKICKDLGILTVAVVTTPFSFESKPRIAAAEGGIEKLKKNVDTLLVIPNDKLIGITDKKLKLEDAFVLADSVLRYTIEGVTNIVFNRGIVNIDFNDIKTTLINKGLGHLGIGTVNEDGAILDAVKQAVNSPLLDTSIKGAANLLINTSGDVTISELNEAVSYVRELAGEEVNIIWGTVSGDVFEKNKIVVTVIATGMPEDMVVYKKPKLEIPEEYKVKRTLDVTKTVLSTEKKVNKEKPVDVIPVFLREYSIK